MVNYLVYNVHNHAHNSPISNRVRGSQRLLLLAGTGVAGEGTADAYPSPVFTLSTDNAERSLTALSDDQWSWLKLHKNAEIEKWRARQHPEQCDLADVLVVELGGMVHGLGSQVRHQHVACPQTSCRCSIDAERYAACSGGM